MAVTEEEFQALKVQVDDQEMVIRKLTNFITYQEGAGHETLESRLADVMTEITARATESEGEVPEQCQRHDERVLEDRGEPPADPGDDLENDPIC